MSNNAIPICVAISNYIDMATFISSKLRTINEHLSTFVILRILTFYSCVILDSSLVLSCLVYCNILLT